MAQWTVSEFTGAWQRREIQGDMVVSFDGTLVRSISAARPDRVEHPELAQGHGTQSVMTATILADTWSLRAMTAARI